MHRPEVGSKLSILESCSKKDGSLLASDVCDHLCVFLYLPPL